MTRTRKSIDKRNPFSVRRNQSTFPSFGGEEGRVGQRTIKLRHFTSRWQTKLCFSTFNANHEMDMFYSRVNGNTVSLPSFFNVTILSIALRCLILLLKNKNFVFHSYRFLEKNTSSEQHTLIYPVIYV